MDNITNKISALLAKAESTDSPHEAEALLAKAQEMMIKHAIDEAMLGDRTDTDEQVGSEYVDLSAKGSPGSQALCLLMCEIARANSVTPLVAADGWHRVRLIGFPSDAASTKRMYHATVLAMIDSEIKSRVNKPPREHGRTWKVSFFNGFVNGMAAKLQRAREAAVADAKAEHGAGADLVLISKDERVHDWIRRNLGMGTSVRWGSQTRSSAGYASGRSAANTVDVRSRGAVRSR